MQWRARYLLVPLGAVGLLFTVFGFAAAAGPEVGPQPLTPIEQLGKSIFFDASLSLNGNQSCASCHGPEVGFTGPDPVTNADGAVYEGSVKDAFGNRKPPSAAYIAQGPVLYLDTHGTWIGGAFWDGRATGWTLGSPTAEQAQGPFLNPKEQALPDAASVVSRVCGQDYDSDGSEDFEQVWGSGACDADDAYELVARSIAAYEASAEVNPFSSRYDRSFGQGVVLTQVERRGFALFMGKAGCSACHPAGKGALFTDFSYDNLGVPKNPDNPVYRSDPDFVDLGLGDTLRHLGYEPSVYEPQLGTQKVPTLRNVAKGADTTVKAFMHNGYFKTLEGVVHFYNTRDVLPTCDGDYTEAQAMASGCWPAAEYPPTVNEDELGNLGLSASDEAALVAFLETLSDEDPR
jgi:cytochrome c peroxidase